MRIIIVSAILLLNLAIQGTILDFLEINNVIPNTSFILIVSYGRLRGDVEGGLFGFVSGLFMDVFYGRVIGMYALLGFISGYIAGKPFKGFYRRNFLTLVVLMGFMTFFYESLFYFMNFLFRGKLDLLYFMHSIIIPVCVYNMLATMIIYPIFYNINRLLEMYERPKRKMFSNLGGYDGKI